MQVPSVAGSPGGGYCRQGFATRSLRRPFNTDCAHLPSSLRHFLGAKNMLDAGARLALVAVGFLLVFS